MELQKANDALWRQMAQPRRTGEALQATRAELARAARITTIGELTASIAHEVNQPLAAVLANADAGVAGLSREIRIFSKPEQPQSERPRVRPQQPEVIARIRSLITKATPLSNAI